MLPYNEAEQLEVESFKLLKEKDSCFETPPKM